MSRAARVSMSPMNLKRDVIIVRLEPARADDFAAHQRELTNDGGRQFKAGEQARHLLRLSCTRRNERPTGGCQEA